MAAKIGMLCLSLLVVQLVFVEGRLNYLQVFQQMFNTAIGGCELYGHTGGCCDPNTSICQAAEIIGGHYVSCSCDEACHGTNTCCHDVNRIGCRHATTCANAGLPAGCCQWNSDNCSTGTCSCDEACKDRNDCCHDVPDEQNCSDSEIQGGSYSELNKEEAIAERLIGLYMRAAQLQNLRAPGLLEILSRKQRKLSTVS